MNLGQLVDEAYKIATDHGWWDPYLPDPDFDDAIGRAKRSTRAPNVPPDGLAAKIMLIVTECAEAVECVRDGKLDARTEYAGKPVGLPSELADIVIRVADLCGALGIDLDEAIRLKLAYNRTRTHRHGGRAL